jgi:hypothetical protein
VGKEPEAALPAWQAQALQQRLRWTEVDVRPPPSKQPRCALLEGFSCMPTRTFTLKICQRGFFGSA